MNMQGIQFIPQQTIKEAVENDYLEWSHQISENEDRFRRPLVKIKTQVGKIRLMVTIIFLGDMDSISHQGNRKIMVLAERGIPIG